MKALLAEKLGMTQIFDLQRNAIPVTILRALANTVLTLKTKEKDGYEAVKIGAGTRKETRVAKAQKGEFGELGMFRYVREFRGMDGDVALARGATITLEAFNEGDMVAVRGISKAKGFQGVVKRHGFHGAPHTHGTKHAHREPGSIGGMGRAGGRVAKGMRMGGRMGGERISVRNLKIVRIDKEANCFALKGAVPGIRGQLIEVRG